MGAQRNVGLILEVLELVTQAMSSVGHEEDP